MKKLVEFLAVILIATTPVAFAETSAWQWQSTLVPKARVFAGPWSEYFQIESALHRAGLPYNINYNVSWPADIPGTQDAVVVLGNTAAPHLGAARLERIKEFVAAGGGLVVLGGLNAFGIGRYAGTPLDDILPVTFDPNSRLDPIPEGAPLTRADSATWLPTTDVSAQPLVYYIQNFAPKSNAVVQLMAGNRPVVVSGTYGNGRVVAIALTVSGEPPPGKLPFWEWPAWPNLLGQMIDWAAAARPMPAPVPGAARPTPASPVKPLTSDELTDFALGLKTPDNLLARALAHPSAAVADALFAHLTAPDATSKLTLAQALPVLVPYAKLEWGPRIVERTEALNPVVSDRLAALTLLGATRWPNATPRLLAALAQPETRLAVVEGLISSSDPKVIPPLRQAYDDALRACQIPGETEYFKPAVFAHESAAVATAAALALYKLGDPAGVERLLAMHRHAYLYWRIMSLASRRAGRKGDNTKATAQLMQQIHDFVISLKVESLDKLQQHAAPIPANHLAAFLKIAQTATDPTDVEWLVAELEASLPAFPPATWQPLTTAQDGIIARLARVASAANHP